MLYMKKFEDDIDIGYNSYLQQNAEIENNSQMNYASTLLNRRKFKLHHIRLLDRPYTKEMKTTVSFIRQNRD